MSNYQLSFRRARRPERLTQEQIRHITSMALPMAKKGHPEAVQYLASGAFNFSEFIKPKIFEAFLENLQASKMPPIESLPISFALKEGEYSFRDPKVGSAFHALRGLANAYKFSNLIQSKSEFGELLVARWLDVLNWMWYFYIASFERSLVDKTLKMDMFNHLCRVFSVGCLRRECALAIAKIPGSIRLATLICMLDAECDFLKKADMNQGTYSLLYLLEVSSSSPLADNISPLDEVLEAVSGDAKLFIDTLLSRIEDALPSPELAEQTMGSYLNLFVLLPDHLKHPLSTALHARNPIAFLTNVLHRLLDILTEAGSGRFGPGLARRVRHLMATLFYHISEDASRGQNRIAKALQALQAGIMTVLIDCAPLAFAFEAYDRVRIVDFLKKLTWLTIHIPIARQASAELEKLERTCSVQARFNASTLDVRNAWVTFYDAILARRTILSQMQSLDSSPMACDNCFRFDERANFKKCAACEMAHYCSKECQSSAWKEKGHRTQCKTLKGKPGIGRQCYVFE
ncbi:hypothetical protein SCHPADRAFT_350635 [Schizopora paradoxa]|uniref:MYND-type domain-containing protein n=1 Tax=Schizopora paradoxa TaxID=27342 RepID=A0A0H2SA33_9AGAM|nr:hypothetical protein SCHPADRAFT_350635 [Schizopora paradoxa]